VLRAKVDALIAGSGTRPLTEVRAPSEQAGPEGREPAGPGKEPARPGQTDELAVRRHRRRAPWLVAAAVAGIVAAGGGGYVAGESGAGAGSMAAVEDSGGAESADDAEPSTLGVPEKADAEAAEPFEAGGDLPAGAGLVFHAGAGLSDTPRTAEVRAGAGGSESLGSYPVVSEVEAVERLGDLRFAGAVLGSRPAPQEDEQARPTAEAPVPGGPIAWPVEDVTIVSARLTEVRYTLADTELLVPAYDLVDDKGNSWTVMAVDEELLDFAP